MLPGKFHLENIKKTLFSSTAQSSAKGLRRNWVSQLMSRAGMCWKKTEHQVSKFVSKSVFLERSYYIGSPTTLYAKSMRRL
jgi:hypothetical protein